MSHVIVSASLDDLRCRNVRLLAEAARLGKVHLYLWSDALIIQARGKPQKFLLSEREYLANSIRYVDRVTIAKTLTNPDALPIDALADATAWVVDPEEDTPAKRRFCQTLGIKYHVLTKEQIETIPGDDPTERSVNSSNKRVLVTGCFDWLHSGHVRFFEEVSALGDLYVVVGHDENIKLLKGEGHPMFPDRQRRYMTSAIRFVTQSLISSGYGWLDAEPEIKTLQPHIYAVNEDGDRPEKRRYCEAHGIEYRVLKRLPKDGLPWRYSTDLRNQPNIDPNGS